MGNKVLDLPKPGNNTNRLHQGMPKDTIPVVKTPRRQRSSRFFAQDNKVELEQYPRFSGKFRIIKYPWLPRYCYAVFFFLPNQTHYVYVNIM